MLIEITRHEKVLQIALNRPEKRNALNLELCNDLVRAFDHADNDTSTGAILLTGNGSAFCAGMDLHEVLEGDTLQLTELHERMFTIVNRIRTPVIAAVHGPALAGGTGLTANAHIVIAAPDARFGLPEIRLGLWPVLVFRACALAMGERRATELSLTGRTIDAEEALRYGLVTEIQADPVRRALEIATSIAAFSPKAISEGLNYVHQIRGRDWTHAGAIGHKMRDQLMQSEEFQRAAQDFLKK
ncbi:MAG: enoyl-CoA hydratase/isomerase family protein [Bryobacteraceae bacterium]